MTSKECKHCEHFDLFANICLIDEKNVMKTKSVCVKKNARITKMASGNHALQGSEEE